MHSSDGLSSASEVRAKARAIERFLEILHNKPAECVSSTHSRDDPVEVRATALAMALVSRVVHRTSAQRAQHVAATQDGLWSQHAMMRFSRHGLGASATHNRATRNTRGLVLVLVLRV